MKYVGLLVKLAGLIAAGYWLIRTDAGALSLFGMIFGGIAALIAGWRIGIAISVASAVAVGIGGSIAPYPVAVVVFATALAFAVGYTSRWGLYAAWLPPFIFGVIAATSPKHHIFPHTSVWVGAMFVGLGSLVAVGALQIPPVFPLFQRLPNLTDVGARIYAGVVAIVVAVLTAFVVGLSLPHGYWLISAFAACIQPDIRRATSRAIRRQVGTIVGIGLGLVVARYVTSATVLWTLAAIAILLCVAFMSHYDISVGFVSLAIVLAASTAGTAATTATNRLVLNLIGAMVVLAIALSLGPLLLRINKTTPLVLQSNTSS